MRISLLNDNDWAGNANRVVTGLADSLALKGEDVMCYVRVKGGESQYACTIPFPSGVVARCLRGFRRGLVRYNRCRWKWDADQWEQFDSGYTQYGEQLLHALPDADILNMHFVAQLADVSAFLPGMTSRCPVVWTMHDMNPFTGGCHYDEGCGRFVSGCGCCPQLKRRSSRDLSAWAWKRKAQALHSVAPQRLHFVSPSSWLAQELKRSPVLDGFPVHIIPNAVDIDAFRPRGKKLSRDLLGLPQKKQIVLFVAQSTQNSLMCPAFSVVAERGQPTE